MCVTECVCLLAHVCARVWERVSLCVRAHVYACVRASVYGLGLGGCLRGYESKDHF